MSWKQNSFKLGVVSSTQWRGIDPFSSISAPRPRKKKRISSVLFNLTVLKLCTWRSWMFLAQRRAGKVLTTVKRTSLVLAFSQTSSLWRPLVRFVRWVFDVMMSLTIQSLASAFPRRAVRREHREGWQRPEDSRRGWMPRAAARNPNPQEPLLCWDWHVERRGFLKDF